MSVGPGKVKDLAKCEACTTKTIAWGLVANFLLAIFKLFVGFLGRSRALVGSGLCNLSDITSSIAVIIGVRYAKRPPNVRYPYGYGKVEFITQVIMSCFMIMGTVALIFSSFIVIAKRIIVIQHMVVFFVAILSAIINALLYKFSHCGGKELNSPVLKAHAEHNKIDVISSLLVGVGVLLTRKGLHWIDPAIAIFECLHVIHGSWMILQEGLKGVMDTNLPDKYTEDIKKFIRQVNGVRKVNDVRARQTGRHIVLDVILQIDPDISVLEAKNIIQKIKSLLREENKYIGHIAIQVVPVE
ncbi:MAG: cation transporter [Candidatus Omnitrophica bacterium]|nr:cation transporter [Candidatus Omnitrophota bacterium]